VFQALMDVLIAEAVSRGQLGLELVSVDSTIVRAHHESVGPAIADETLDALEQALTEEKGTLLPTQRQVLRVISRRPRRVRKARARLPIGIAPTSGGAGGRGRGRLDSAGPEAG
jgi:hypothetical protein